MMDQLTKRSALISTAVHLIVGVAAWFSTIGASDHDPSVTPEQPPEPAVVNQSESGQIVIAAEDAAIGEMSAPPPLPPLAAGQHQMAVKLPDVTVTVPQATDHPGATYSRGESGLALSELRLPASASEDQSLSGELRSLRSTASADRAERMRRTAADHLDSRLRSAYRAAWRAYDRQISQRQLVVELMVDRKGLVTTANLLNSTGVEDLDRKIINWLKSPGVGLPPIEADVVHRFLVELK
jgi:hypothetical protein